MKDNVSPEEKLLRLIRGTKKRTQEIALDKRTLAKSGHKPTFKFSLPNLIRKYAFYFEIHKIMLALFILAAIYLISSFIYPLLALKKIKLPAVTPKEIIETPLEPKAAAKPYEYYLEGTQARAIFTSPQAQETSRPQSAVLTDLTKDLNLVGIIAGENPQAIIEDKKAQKTYYVSKGQFLNEFQVEDIQEGKIILNYQGQRFELHL